MTDELFHSAYVESYLHAMRSVMLLRPDAFRGEREVAENATRSRKRLLTFARDPQYGIHAYPTHYAKHHPELVAEYERVRGQSRAVLWLMRHDNLGAWEGVAEPLVERLQSFLLY